MASWTDVNAPQFTPYRQQLPVDAMVQVGMQKQQQYEQGIEKIQTSIDRVAGMDVAREIDQRYLQSKVNELGNKLKFAAAGDFSNFQLVNSLTGMTNQIAKDKNVMNAVSSTARYRKEVGRMEKAREEGKSSIQNEAYFANRANDWLSSQDINRSFDAQYRENIDVDKKWMDVLKSLHSDLIEEDVPYVQNPDGTIDYMQTAAAMQRRSSERVSSSKIENALRASLTPDELQQLNINGWYQFRDATPEQLAIQSKVKFDRSIQTNLDRIRELEGLANFTDDPQLKMNANNSIASLRSMNTSLRKDYDDELRFVQQNPDLAKGLIYKNGAIAQFAQAHSWEHSKSNLMTNPILQAQFEQERINISRANQSLAERRFSYDQIKDQAEFQLKRQQFDLDVQKELNKNGGQTPFTTFYGTGTNIPAPLTAANDKINTLTNESEAIRQTLLQKIPGLTATQLENAKLAYLNGDEQGMKKADSFVKGRAKELFDQMIQIDRDKNILTSSIQQVEKDVLDSPSYRQKRQEFENELAEIGQVAFSLPNGQTINYSEDEILSFLEKVNVQGEKIAYSPFGFAAGLEHSRVEEPTGQLSDKERALYDNMSPKLQNILSKYNTKKKNFDEDLRGDVQNEYAQRVQSYTPMASSIVTPNAESRNQWEGILGAVASRFNDPLGGTRGGSAEVSPDDIETLQSWFGDNDKSNLQYRSIIIPGTGQTYLNVQNGTETITLPLTAQEATQLPINMGQAASPDYIRLMDVQTASGLGTTNPSGTFENAYFNRIDMPNVTLNLKADMEQDFSNPNIQYINLKLRSPQGDIDLTLDKKYLSGANGGYISPTNAIKFIRELTDKQVVDLFMSNPGVSPEQKQIIQSLIQSN